MQKDFDAWNTYKKSVDTKQVLFGFHERELWWISLGINIGVEMDSKNQAFERPAVILRKFNREMVWIIPITSRIKDSRFYKPFIFEGDIYYVALTQIKTVSSKRLIRKIGMIDIAIFEAIRQKIRYCLE